MPENIPEDKTHRQSYSAANADEQRDLAAKGGPSTGVGIPNNKHGIESPYDADTQTQLAAASTGNNANSGVNTKETKSLEDDWITGEGDDAPISTDKNKMNGE